MQVFFNKSMSSSITSPLGILPSTLSGSNCGVFIGMSTNDYSRIPRIEDGLKHLDGFYARGNVNCVAAGRLAYFYDLVGPVLTIDTACSSSLVAVHLAVQVLLHLRQHEVVFTILGTSQRGMWSSICRWCEFNIISTTCS